MTLLDQSRWASCIWGSGLLFAAFQAANAQEININDGQVLTETDLLAGMFQGSMFSLGASTTFNVNLGGQIAPLGSFAPDSFSPFDFRGSRIRVASGGVLAAGVNDRPIGPSAFSDAIIDVVSGGQIWESFWAFNSSVNLNGAIVERSVRFNDQSVVVSTASQLGRDMRIQGGSSLVMQGGFAGLNLDISQGSSFTLRSGSVSNSIGAGTGSVINIEGGSVGTDGALFSGSTLNMSGGSLGIGFDVFSGVANISGGTVAGMLIHGGGTANIMGGMYNGIRARESGVVNLSGGSISGTLELSQTATLNLFVHEIRIAGEVLDLEQGVATLITRRDEALLEAVLSDGSLYDFRLSNTGSGDTIADGASVRVTLVVPGPGSVPLVLAACCVVSRRRR